MTLVTKPSHFVSILSQMVNELEQCSWTDGVTYRLIVSWCSGYHQNQKFLNKKEEVHVKRVPLKVQEA